MDWATFALLSAAGYGLLSILNKVNIEKHVSNVFTFGLVQGIPGIGIGFTILFLKPLPPDVSLYAISLGLGSGLIESVGLLLIFIALRTGEVTRVVPVTQSYPIFVAVLAALFLGETLNWIQWLAILATVAGAILISIDRAPGGRVFITRSFAILILSAFLLGVSRVLGKEALESITFWNMVALSEIAICSGFTLAGLQRATIKEGISILRKPRSLFWILMVHPAVTWSLMFQFAAFAAGPVSLGSALIATRSFFIFLYTILLSWLVPRVLREPLNPGVLLLKIVSIGMIVGGCSLIILG